jgi:parallel beta-helix repeat protein
MKNTYQLKTVVLVFVLLLFCIGTQAGIIYVKSGGVGSGTSWADATGDIQQAINVASSGTNVYVAEGNYKITTSIVLKEGVEIYGGFAGNETATNQRQKSDLDGNGFIEDWEFAYPTVLYGDGNDRIITHPAQFTTVIDGFTLTRGKATNGGGVFLQGNGTISACTVVENTALDDGGGIYLSNATMSGCLVKNNIYSRKGGGVYATQNSLIERCKIENNTLPIGNVKVGDVIGDGIVYSVNYENHTAEIVSIAKIDETIWSNAATQSNTLGEGFLLPNSIQLQKVYTVKDVLNSVIEKTEGVPFSNEAYWTSTEAGDRAFQVIFDTGYAGTLEKTASLLVRGVKSISF